jgi:hypothetical protein
LINKKGVRAIIHIILLILKVIGIILLSIIGLLLLLTLIVLFSPICYKIKANGGIYPKDENDTKQGIKEELLEKSEVMARVSWFLGLVGVKYNLSKGKQIYKIRILFFTIFNSDKPKKKKKVKRRVKVKKTKNEESTPIVDDFDDLYEEKKKELSNNQLEGSDNFEQNKKEETEQIKEVIQVDKSFDKESVQKLKMDSFSDSSNLQSEGTFNQCDVEEESEGLHGKARPHGEDTDKVNLFSDKQKGNIFQKIKEFFHKFASIFEKIKKIQNKIKSTFKGIYDKIRKIYKNTSLKINYLSEKKELITAFLEDKVHKKAILLVKKKAFWLIKKILPKKFDLQLNFGLEDPGTMGTVLVFGSILYPFVDGNLTLNPNFDEKEINGNLFIKGHMIIGIFLIAGLRILLSKACRQTYKDARKLQTNLKGK